MSSAIGSYSIVCCTMLDYAMLWDNMVRYGVVRYGMVWYGQDYMQYGRGYGRDNADSLALQICRLVVLGLIIL